MAIAQLVLSYLQVLVWPITVGVTLWCFQDVIRKLASGSDLTINFGIVSVKVPRESLEPALEANLRGQTLSKEQWGRLEELRDKERVKFDFGSDYKVLLPLRNAGLIWPYPIDRSLTTAEEVGISPFGRLLFDAWERNQRSH
jgi:hypothetical protein